MQRSWAFPALLAIALITAASAFYFGKPHASNRQAARYADARDGCTRSPYEGGGCFVPFPRLIAFPERYQGREIRTIGFLMLARDGYDLYPSEEDTVSAKGLYESITIYNRRAATEPRLVDGDIEARMQTEPQHGVWVSVSGVFDAGGVTDPNGQLGALLRAHDVRDVTHRGWSRPSPPDVHLRAPASPPEAPRVDTAPGGH